MYVCRDKQPAARKEKVNGINHALKFVKARRATHELLQFVYICVCVEILM